LKPSCRIAGFLLCCAVSAAGQEAPAPHPVSADQEVEMAPVVIDGAELFKVRGTTGFPAARRAGEIAARIERLAADPAVAPETLSFVHTEAGTEIRAGQVRVVLVSKPDAELVGLPADLLARLHLQRIQEAMRAFRDSRSRESLLRSTWRSLAASAAFALALLLLRGLFRRVTAGAERRFLARVRSVAIGSFEFVRADRLWSYLRRILRGLRLLAALALFFFYLHFFLGEFPWTRGAAANLGDWTLGPVKVLALGLLGFLPNLLFLIVLFIFTRWALNLIQLFFDAVGSGEVTLEGFDPDWAAPTFKLVRVAILVFALVVGYPYIPGSESPAFKGISLFLGLVFSLGSSSAISNIIAGYTMTYRRLFREGDRVKIGDVIGAVTQIRLQVTHIRTPKNEEAVIPNSTILNSEVINYSTMAKSEGLILHTTVGIGYETPWRQVEAMLLLAAERTPGLAPGRKHFVLQKALTDFAVTYELNAYIDDPARVPFLYSELHRQILDVFNEFNIQIMTPAYEGDPERPKVVPREEWFAAPASPGPASPERSDRA
jgi:small-conductance mechanosensitive channel